MSVVDRPLAMMRGLFCMMYIVSQLAAWHKMRVARSPGTLTGTFRLGHLVAGTPIIIF